MEEGRIIKIISNRYEVLDASGVRNVCVAMGKLRKHMVPVVGDMVCFERFDNQIGIQKLLPRKNILRRPSIANVDQAIIIMSVKEPDFSSILLDRLIFQVVYANIKPVLCFTKLDLIAADDPIHNAIMDYRNSGYMIFESGEGYANEALCHILGGKISVLTGQSGAGKSSLLNRIEPDFQLQTQAISKALGRGKHTTRHCELHEVKGGWVADTPGFSSLDFSHMNIRQLQERIPDFQPYLNQCKYADCIHINEPDCQIQAMVKQGNICQERYQHYKEVTDLIAQYKPKY